MSRKTRTEANKASNNGNREQELTSKNNLT